MVVDFVEDVESECICCCSMVCVVLDGVCIPSNDPCTCTGGRREDEDSVDPISAPPNNTDDVVISDCDDKVGARQINGGDV